MAETHSKTAGAETAGAEPPEGGAHEGSEAHGGNSFPPFNAETFTPQLSWLVLTFILLYVLMSRVALPKIGRVLEERRDKIADDLDQAAKLKQEADAALKAYEAALAAARARAQAIGKETADKLRAESDRLKADIEAKLAREAQAAEARILAVKNAALSNLRAVSTEVATAVIGRLLDEQPSAGAVEQAIDAELAGR